jgi:hypothetical protein
MQRAYYFDGIRIDSGLLNYDITAKNSTIANRVKAILNCAGISAGSGSLVGRPGDTTLEISGVGSSAITAAAGDAIDINGEYISVKDETYQLLDFEPAKPSKTVSVVGWADGEYRFGVKYAVASGCIKSNREGEALAVRYFDSYEWVHPSGSISPTVGDIYLATVNVSGDEVISIVDNRTYQWLSAQVDASKIYITDPQVTTITTLQEHVDAVGTATPTATNPHGIQLYTDFNDLANTPTGLIGGAMHGSNAHDYTVPISRTSTYTMEDITLSPIAEGGGVVWIDGISAVVGAVEFIADSEIDCKYRWITITGFAHNAINGGDYYPSGSKAYEMLVYIDQVTPSTSKFVCGHFYSSAGGNGTTYPYVTLKPWNSQDYLIIWVASADGKLMGKVNNASNDATLTFAFGLCVEYGPIRKRV